MEDSIFTKIIKGEIPCHKIYEDEKTIALLDIHPVQPGHVLVVSKAQIDHFMDLPDDYYHALMDTVKKVALRLHEVLPDKRIGVQIEGLDVAHAHVKLIPISSGAQFRVEPDFTREADQAELAIMADKLRL